MRVKTYGGRFNLYNGRLKYFYSQNSKNVVTAINSTDVTLNATQRLSAHYLMGKLTQEQIITLINNALYGILGGTAESHKWNWLDLRDLDAANRLSFLGGGWLHDALGAKPNGTASYANTFVTVTYDVNGVAPDMHISYSTNENTANISNEAVMGDRTAGSQCRLIIKRSAGTGFSLITQSTTIVGRVFTMPSDIRGLSIANKISSVNILYNNFEEVQNGLDVSQTTSFSSNSITIGGVIVPVPQFTDKRCNGATIGSDLPADKALLMSIIFSNYNKILNRI